jgi:phytanoyl-CoA hydroxylase
MRNELSREQIEAYGEDGFLVIEDFLDAGEVEHLRGIVTEAAAALDDSGGRVLLPDTRMRRHEAQFRNLWQTDERVRAFCTDRRLGRLACELGGVDGVRLAHDRGLNKPAWADATGWHTDSQSLAFTHPGTCVFWFALVDTDLRNGCLYYVNGSHKLRVGTKGNGRIDGLKLLHPEWESAEPMPCPVRAGALVVHNGDTAHATCPNITPVARPAFAIAWMPVGATFNGTPDGLPEDVASTLQAGDPLDLDDLFPLVHRR